MASPRRLTIISTAVSTALHPETLKPVQVLRHGFSNGGRALIYDDGRQLLIDPQHHVVPPASVLGQLMTQLVKEALH